MINKEDAMKVAKEYWDEIDYCTEYENAYLFSKKDHMAFGGPGPVAITKSDGTMLNMTYFVDSYNAGEVVSEGYIGEQ